MRVLDSIGTLQHDAPLDPYWNMIKRLGGYHQGCDPKFARQKDPVKSRLQHAALRAVLDKHSPGAGAGIACDQLDCMGTEQTS